MNVLCFSKRDSLPVLNVVMAISDPTLNQQTTTSPKSPKFTTQICILNRFGYTLCAAFESDIKKAKSVLS